VEQRTFAAWERLGTKPGVREAPSDAYARDAGLEMLEAVERQRVLESP
jgi:hypothetical protein